MIEFHGYKECPDGSDVALAAVRRLVEEAS